MSLMVKVQKLQRWGTPFQNNSITPHHDDLIFLKSLQHSQRVRFLRIFCPTLGLLLISWYVFSLTGTGGFLSQLPQVPVPHITTQDLAMHNPHYEGVTKEGGRYHVKALIARQDFGDMNLVQLETISGELIQLDKSKTYLKAVRGTYDQKANVLVLQEKIEITNDNGMKAHLKSATFSIKEGIIVSKEPVEATFPAGTIQSQELLVLQKEHKISFVRDVICNLNPANAPGDQMKTESAGAFGSTGEPILVLSDTLDIDDPHKTATFKGDVRAKQSGSSLQTPEMIVHYENTSHETVNAGQVSTPEGHQAAVTTINVKGPFLMTRGEIDKVTGNNATFDNKKQSAHLQGNVRIISLPDKNIAADVVDLDQKEDSALLTGNVTVINGETILKGSKLFVERKKGRTSLSSPSSSPLLSGRITAHFVRKDIPAKKSPLLSSTPPLSSSSISITELKTNPSAPIDIEANRLDIDDQKKIAVFNGNVHVKQEGTLMVSPTLKAYYTGTTNLADPENIQRSSSTSKSSPQLSRLEASENVMLKTDDGRKINGDWANFETKSNSLVIGGDVELNQGNSTIRGTRLIFDMTTSRGTIDTAPIETFSKDQGKSWSPHTEIANPSPASRPSAIFFPNEFQTNKNEKGVSKPNNGSP